MFLISQPLTLHHVFYPEILDNLDTSALLSQTSIQVTLIYSSYLTCTVTRLQGCNPKEDIRKISCLQDKS